MLGEEKSTTMFCLKKQENKKINEKMKMS